MTTEVFKAHPIKIILASFSIMLFIGIQVWERHAPLPIRDWNKKEISRIKVSDSEGFAFAVFGDNKGNSTVFEPLLRDIDHRTEIAFAIDLGDLVNVGKRGHYRRLLNQLKEYLAIPLLTAIGNHDLNNGGSRNYREIFGSTYYTFQVGESYFVVLDATTESGFDRAERQWLEVELQKAQTSKTRFVFLHVPPFDPRANGFNKCLREGKDLLDLFRRYKVTHLFASHIHGYFSGVWEGVPYTVTGGAGGELQGRDPEHFFHHYVQVNVHDGKVATVVRSVNAEGILSQFLGEVKDDVVEWGLLVGAGVLLFTLGFPMRRKKIS